jgi:hypothetical protein
MTKEQSKEFFMNINVILDAKKRELSEAAKENAQRIISGSTD